MQYIARYAAVTAPGLNQRERLQPDETGYFKCILGGFNVENSAGEYYPLAKEVSALFEVGGIVRRRLDSGLCKGEYGHPKVAGMPLQEALQRLAFVDPLTTSHHIKAIELQPGKDEYNKDLILAVGWVRPTGPYGSCLNDQLLNPEENVAFSLRSFTNSNVIKGKLHKIVKDALTYDFVSEGGIKEATQFNTASLEELKEFSLQFTQEDLTKAIDNTVREGLESDFSTLTMVRDSLGWNKVQVIKANAFDWR